MAGVGSLEILQWNAGSIRNNSPDLYTLLRTQQPHIVGIQETWLNQNDKRHAPKFPSYDCYRIDRKTKRGGGILMLIRNDVIYNKKILLPYNNGQGELEIQAITIKANFQEIDIVNLYNKPSYNLTDIEIKHYLSQISKNYLIMGDFNAHHSAWEPLKTTPSNYTGRTIYQLLIENTELTLATPPNLPTHTYRYGAETSTIDLLLCPQKYLPNINILTMADLGSDHIPLLNIIELNPETQKLGKRPKWIFNTNKWDNWLQEVENYVETESYSIPDEIKQFAESLVKPGEDTFRKSKDIVNTKKNKIWWNEHCARATACRRRAKNKMNRTPTQQNIQNYRRLHAAARKIHKLAKRTAWRNYVSTISPKTKPKDIWKIIRNFKGLKTTKRSNLLQNDRIIYNIKEKTELHAQFFQSSMNRQDIDNIPHEDIQLIDRIANSLNDDIYNDSFKIHEIENAIDALPTDKACGIDYVHNQFLKHLPYSKKIQLLGIFNKIWMSGEVPDEWKIGLIYPILKDGKDPQLVSSYRPITLLSCIGKLMEKMVHDRLVYIIETKKFLRDTQYGFRCRKGTIDPIISLEHQIRKGLVNKKVTIVVFFDLKAAFDTVDHMILLKTLAQLNIGGRMLTWIISYLSNRKIQVILENTYSNIFNINCGVPQGSILSPILFIILLSTLPNIFPVVSNELADDIAFSVTADTLEEASRLMQVAVSQFAEWCEQTKLTINVQKTKCMCFTSKRRKTPTITLNGLNIEVVNSYKYLGMILDAPYLTWEKHITMLINKCTKNIYILRALAGTTWGADRDSLLKINEALNKSRIAYGCPAFLSASTTQLNRLEVLQNNSLRLAVGAWKSTQVPNLQIEANIAPIKLYIHQQSIILFYRIKALGPSHPVHQIFHDIDVRNKVYTKLFKEPFIIKSKK